MDSNLRARFETGVQYLLGRRLESAEVSGATDRVFVAVESAIAKDESLLAGDLPGLIRKAIDVESVCRKPISRVSCSPQKALTARLSQLKPKELSALRAYYSGKGEAPAIASELRKGFLHKGTLIEFEKIA